MWTETRLDRLLLALGFGCMVGLGGAWPSTARAQGLDSISISPDITVELDGTPVDDEDVATDDRAGAIQLAPLGDLPASAEVTAFHALANGDRLFALDTTVQLAGPLVVDPRDVVRFDGGAYALEFDGDALGMAAGSRIDALSQGAGGELLLSFDTTLDLGGGVIAADEDVVSWNGANFALAFDGSEAGIDAGLDLDGVHHLGGGVLGLSFDASGSVAGVSFADEDVLRFDPSGPSWSIAYDGSVQHAALEAADVQAVSLPEPRLQGPLAAGAAALILLRFRAARRPR